MGNLGSFDCLLFYLHFTCMDGWMDGTRSLWMAGARVSYSDDVMMIHFFASLVLLAICPFTYLLC